MKTSSDQISESVIPISYGSTEVIETGKWGFQKPETSFMTAPCQESCPAGNPIPQFLYLATEGRYPEAAKVLLRENPFPGVCGRVCFHPCEADCNRGEYDEPVSIQAMERYVFDSTHRQLMELQPMTIDKPGQVAVVGSGPAGLSCAYFLSLLGHRVSVFEAKKELGGVMRWGIPEYRLPKTVLRKEIQRILSLGIEAKKNVRVGVDIPFEALNRFDAVFLSPGAQEGMPLEVQGKASKRVWRGEDFLETINSARRIAPGREVIVIGGGNTAMDVARSAMRLGAKVTIAYRRTRAEMPAIADEIHEAEEEGAAFEFLVQPVKITEMKNKKISVTFQRMRLGRRDESNRRRAIPVAGETMTLKADGLITAVGERVDVSWAPGDLVRSGLIHTGPFHATSVSRIFAGGDAVDQPRTVVTAISAGKKAAISIDLTLNGRSLEDVFPKIRVGAKGSVTMEAYLAWRKEGSPAAPKEVVPYEKINTLYFAPSERITIKKTAPEKALKSFSEVNPGLTAEQAAASASRCFSCGTCNYCLNCYFFCPEGAISMDKSAQRKDVDLEHCKGCGTCARACPRSVVEMKETS